MQTAAEQSAESHAARGLTLLLDRRHKEHRERVSRTLEGRKRRWIVALVLAAITLGSGLLNLFSVMGGPSHSKLLEEIFPLGFIHLSRTLTLLIGFALVISSINIYKRKSRAWWIVLGLSAFSALFHLVRGPNFQEAVLSLALVGLLVLTRGIFSVKSGAPDFRSGVLRLTIAAGVAVGYGIAGFWFLDTRHFGINFHIGNAVVTTLRFLALGGDTGLVPHTAYGHWFLNSLYLTTITAVVYSGFALFRPVIYQFRTLPRERAMARQIMERHARGALDFFKVWDDKSYLFSPSHQSFLAYRVGAGAALALGDPVGPESEIESLVREFSELCRENGWSAAFHQTLPDFLPIYLRVGLKKLKIGDDAIVDLKGFTLEGKSKKEFRYKVRQLEGMGIHTTEYQPPVPEKVIAQLKEVSDEWLRIPGRRERSFTLGMFTREYVRSTTVLAATDKNGKALAFVNLIAVPGRSEITIDLMRRRTEAPNGIMDYLFVKLFLYARDKGFARLNLGMAPMAGFQEREEAGAEERAIHSFFQQLNFLFSFRGLRQYKAKFATSWEPRYLIYRNALELPRLALALRRVSEVADEEENAGEED